MRPVDPGDGGGSTGLGLALFAGFSILVGGCADDSRITEVPGDGGNLVLAPSEVSLFTRDTVTFQAWIRNRTGQLSPVEGPLAWAVSDRSVAQVSEDGTALALLPGTTQVLVRSPLGDAQATLSVFPALEDLTLSVEADTIVAVAGLGVPLPLLVTVTDVRAEPVEGVEVHFEMDAAAGTIGPSSGFTDDNGRLHAEWYPGSRAGLFDILVSTPGLRLSQASAVSSGQPGEQRIERTVAARVHPAPPFEVVVVPSELELAPGQAALLELEVQDRFGSPVEAPETSWSSSDGAVATVDQDGKVLGMNPGEAVIRVRVFASGGGKAEDPGLEKEGFSAEASVAVADPSAAGLHVRAGQGQSAQVGTPLASPLEVRANSESGGPMPDVSISWELVQGTGSLTVQRATTDSTGIASAVLMIGTSAGPRVVMASAPGMSPVSFFAEGTPAPMTSILVAPAQARLRIGEDLFLSATALDQYANVVFDEGVAWRSEADDIATVSADGRVLATGAGNARITASASGVEGETWVEVTNDDEQGTDGEADEGQGDEGGEGLTPPGGISDLRVVAQGADSLVIAFTEADNGKGGPANYEVRYQLDSQAFDWAGATPAESGTCRGPLKGSSIGSELRCSLTGFEAGIEVGVRLMAWRELPNGERLYGEPSNIATGSTALPSDPSGSLTLNPSSLDIAARGGTGQFEAAGKDAQGSPMSLESVEWRSSDPTVATVSKTGVVTGIKVGTVFVIASAACCTADSGRVTVHAPPDQLPNFDAVVQGVRPRGFGQGEYVLSTPVGGTEYFVSPAGKDEDPGTRSRPFRTIQRAAQMASAGDVVTIKDGVYTESVSVRNGGTESRPIVFQAENRGEVILTGGRHSFQPEGWNGGKMTSGPVWVTLRGLVFSEYSGDGEFDFSVNGATGWKIEDCLFEGSRNGANMRGDFVQIVRSTFQDHGDHAFGAWGPLEGATGPHDLEGHRGLYVADVIIRRNGGWEPRDPGVATTNVKILASHGAVFDNIESYENIGPGLWLDHANNGYVIRNSYFHRNRSLGEGYTTGMGLMLEIGWAPGLVENCVFAHNDGEGIGVVMSAGVTIRRNLFVGNLSPIRLYNFDYEPKFTLEDVLIEYNGFKDWQEAGAIQPYGDITAATAGKLNVFADHNVYEPGRSDWLSWFPDAGVVTTIEGLRTQVGWEKNGMLREVPWNF